MSTKNYTRKCTKCGKRRICYVHREGNKSCKRYTRPTCRACAKEYYDEWYSDPDNRAKKIEYMRLYYAGLITPTRRKIGPTR